MFRKLILQLLIKLYVNKLEGVNKLTPEQEMNKYLFKNSVDTLDIIKASITTQTLRHFEATSNQERWMVKGAALALKYLKDQHLKALRVEKIKTDEKKLKEWLSN